MTYAAAPARYRIDTFATDSGINLWARSSAE